MFAIVLYGFSSYISTCVLYFYRLSLIGTTAMIIRMLLIWRLNFLLATKTTLYPLEILLSEVEMRHLVILSPLLEN